VIAYQRVGLGPDPAYSPATLARYRSYLAGHIDPIFARKVVSGDRLAEVEAMGPMSALCHNAIQILLGALGARLFVGLGPFAEVQS